jgi:hypothetical protein
MGQPPLIVVKPRSWDLKLPKLPSTRLGHGLPCPYKLLCWLLLIESKPSPASPGIVLDSVWSKPSADLRQALDSQGFPISPRSPSWQAPMESLSPLERLPLSGCP